MSHESAPHTAANLDLLSALRALTATDRQMRSTLAQLARPYGLNDTQSLVLHCCAAAAETGASQSELAEQLGISPAAISDLVERMRRQQLLVGDRSPTDRRRQVWQVTDDGRAALGHLRHACSVWAAQPEAGIDADLLDTVTKLLEVFVAAARSCPVDAETASTTNQNSSRKAA